MAGQYFGTARIAPILRAARRPPMESVAAAPPELLELLQSVDTCTVANAMETLNLRMRNDGYIQHPLKCLLPSLPPIAGHAVTGRIRTGAPPISNLCYYHRADWWEYMSKFPPPTIMVLSDVDHAPGTGAFVGEIHAEISRALGCVGYVTNGSIRDVAALERNKFQCFSGGVSPSHAYGHMVDFGEPVEIGCLKIAPGDILQGDVNGVQSIPRGVAAELARAVRNIKQRESELIRLCRSPDFSIGQLTAMLGNDAACPPRNRL